jgi:hypothetical protein
MPSDRDDSLIVAWCGAQYGYRWSHSLLVLIKLSTKKISVASRPSVFSSAAKVVNLATPGMPTVFQAPYRLSPLVNFWHLDQKATPAGSGAADQAAIKFPSPPVHNYETEHAAMGINLDGEHGRVLCMTCTL